MKYLYIFKKTNGDHFLEEETLAFKHIYQGENQREPFTYIGRFPSNNFLETQYELINKVKEFKKDLLEKTTGLQKAIDNGNTSGAFSTIEAEYAKKVQDFSEKLDKERMEKFISISKKEYMDRYLNIDTPGGDRQAIINLLR